MATADRILSEEETEKRIERKKEKRKEGASPSGRRLSHPPAVANTA